MRRAVCFCLAALCMLGGPALATAGSFDSLLARVPSDANTIVLADTAKVRGTKYAAREWSDEYNARLQADGHLFAPRELQRAVLAANLDMQALETVWSVGVLQPIAAPSLEGIARQHGGRLEKLAGVPTAWLPTGAYVALLGPHVAGIYSPADRQSAARWIRTTSGKSAPTLSAVLTDAAQSFDRGQAQLVLALDVQDSISPSLVRERLQNSPTLKERHVPVERISALLAGVKGIVLSVRFDEQAEGTLALEFGQSPGVLADFAPQLIYEITALAGAELADFREWRATVSGDTLQLTGRLSPRSLRQILSLVSPPAVEMKYDQPLEPERSPNAIDPKLLATQRYYKSLQLLLADVSHPEKLTGTVTPGSYALWLERYARKIDQLSLLNVDSELVNFGAQVASGLRQLGGNYKGVGIQASTQSSNVSTSFGTFNLGYGYYNSGDANAGGLDARSAARRAGTAQAAQSQANMMPSILDGMAQMRRVLTQRYQVEF